MAKVQGTRVNGNVAEGGHLGNYHDAGDNSSLAKLHAMMEMGYTQAELEYGTGQTNGVFESGGICMPGSDITADGYGAPNTIPTPPRAVERSMPHKPATPGKSGA